MLLVKKHYTDPDIKSELAEAFNNVFTDIEQPPLFLFIGSDRHVLDCLGPLAGSMLQEKCPHLLIYGTLDSPVHARNIVEELDIIRIKHPDNIQVAIDASVGDEEALGIIKLRRGSLIPGKALAKKLPPVGDISVTAIVGTQLDKKRPHQIKGGSLKHVYHMCQVISEAIYEWDNHWESI